jgi:hypothetical protein
MICKIAANFVDYDYLAEARKLNKAIPNSDIDYTEYRRSRMEAETAVFKFLRKIQLELSGQFTPNGESIIPQFEIQTGRFVFEKTYYPKSSYTSHICFRYIVKFTELEALPEGKELKRDAFIFEPSYDNIEAWRPIDTITDWEVAGARRFPFKPTWDFFRVILTTPSGSETAGLDFDNQGGTFNLRGQQPCNVRVTEQLLSRALEALAKVA